jgi:RNA polymerase sigma-70 factor (ECF subfamily)
LDRREQDALYGETVGEHGATIRRLARGYEADADRRRDLVQEIHLELWRSLASFDGRCGLRTWVYRVAHNVAASHIVRERRVASRLVDLEGLEMEPVSAEGSSRAEDLLSAQTLLGLIHRLRPMDRQIMLLYLEGESAAGIAQVTGLSPPNIATKIHRLKALLRRQYAEGESDG